MRKKKAKFLRESFPPIRVYNVNGKERYLIDARSKKRGIDEQHWRTDKTEAINLAKEIANKLVVGEPLTKDEMRTFAHYREQFNKYDIKIERVLAEKLARLMRNEDKEEGNKVLTADAVDEWEKEKLNGETVHYRAPTVREVGFTAKAIKANWGNMLVSSIKTEHVEEYLRSLKGKIGQPAALVTKRNWKVRLGVFFNWCWRRKKYIYGNPCATITYKIPKMMPRIMEVDEVKAMLKLAEENPRFHQVVNYLAVGFFAGLRPEEIEKLKWEKVKLDAENPHIWIDEDVAKVRRARPVPILPTLQAFLKAYRSEPLCAPNHRKLFTELKIAAGFGLRGNPGKAWIVDGMRHTFASMHWGVYKAPEKLAADMGNSYEVIVSSYKRPVDEATAKKYWEIKPIKDTVDESKRDDDVKTNNIENVEPTNAKNLSDE